MWGLLAGKPYKEDAAQDLVKKGFEDSLEAMHGAVIQSAPKTENSASASGDGGEVLPSVATEP